MNTDQTQISESRDRERAEAKPLACARGSVGSATSEQTASTITSARRSIQFHVNLVHEIAGNIVAASCASGALSTAVVSDPDPINHPGTPIVGKPFPVYFYRLKTIGRRPLLQLRICTKQRPYFDERYPAAKRQDNDIPRINAHETAR